MYVLIENDNCTVVLQNTLDFTSAWHKINNVTFLPRCMQCRRGLAMRICPSVRPSVCLSVKRGICDKMEER